MTKDPSLIPKGMYCHDEKNVCPYWKATEDDYYCAFQEINDSEIYPFGLLFDQCKECGINEEDDDNVLCDTGL